MLLLSGCSELPEVQYHREGFDLAVEFEHPVCEGTLRAMEERVMLVGRETDRRQDVPMTIYWLDGELDRICPRPTSGCFIPGTHIVASTGDSLHHEIVHAVMNTRGALPYAEEGLAEVLSGVASYRSPYKRAHPLQPFGMTRKDAREGDIDYDRAAHFMHFVRREADEDVVAALAEAIDRDDSAAQVVALLEHHLDRTAPEIEQAYAEAPAFYPSIREDETDPITAFDLVAGINLSLDCRHEETFGPLSEESGGMYHLLRIESDTPLRGTVYLEADPGVRVSLFREVDPDGAWVQDWWNPIPWLDEGRIDLRGGERAAVDLDPSEHWLLMVRASDSSRAKGARLQLRPAS